MFLGHHQRFVDQLLEVFQGVRVFRDRFEGLEPPASGKNGSGLQQALLFVREQVVAPVDQRAQGLLARQRGAAPAHEQVEAVIQPPGDLFRGKQFGARAAANSIARGMPSSREQICAIEAVSAGSNLGFTALARSTKSCDCIRARQ